MNTGRKGGKLEYISQEKKGLTDNHQSERQCERGGTLGVRFQRAEVEPVAHRAPHRLRSGQFLRHRRGQPASGPGRPRFSSSFLDGDIFTRKESWTETKKEQTLKQKTETSRTSSI